MQDFKKEEQERILKQREVMPVIVGYNKEANEKAYEIAKEHRLPYVLGIAPQTIVEEGLDKLEMWKEEISEAKPFAIGEIGLDYKWGKTEEQRKAERQAFEEQMELAEKLRLPIVIHCRQCCDEVVEVIKEFAFKGRVMMHSFSCKVKHAHALLDFNPLFSLNTWKSKEKKALIKAFPIEYLAVETDSPYIARTPLAVKSVIEEIAELKAMPKEDVEARTAENVATFLGIEKRLGRVWEEYGIKWE